MKQFDIFKPDAFTSTDPAKILTILSSCSFFSDFSKRESEVAILLLLDMSAKEIAGKLNITARTVEGHKLNIQRKLKVNSTIGILSRMLFEVIEKQVELRIDS